MKVFFYFFFFYFVENKYFYKKKPKTPQLSEFNIPQVPELSKFIYPAIQKSIVQNSKYNELISAEDLAQVETGVGVIMPLNIALNLRNKVGLIQEGLKIKNK